MENKELLNNIVMIHNQVSSINVCGDDVLTMAKVIQSLREIVFTLGNSIENDEISLDK